MKQVCTTSLKTETKTHHLQNTNRLKSDIQWMYESIKSAPREYFLLDAFFINLNNNELYNA